MIDFTDSALITSPSTRYLLYYPDTKTYHFIQSSVSITNSTNGKNALVVYRDNHRFTALRREKGSTNFTRTYMPEHLRCIANFMVDYETGEYFLTKDNYAMFNETTGEYWLSGDVLDINQRAVDSKVYVAYIQKDTVRYLYKPAEGDHHWKQIDEKDVPEAFITYVMVIRPTLKS